MKQVQPSHHSELSTSKNNKIGPSVSSETQQGISETHLSIKIINMEYKHEPLKGDHDIRLLKLLPFGRSAQSPLACELITRRLQQSGKDGHSQSRYEALSYSWEGQAPDRILICNGKKLMITANCEAACYQLRYRTRTRLLWIDSICINQTLNTEKSKQVQMMGDIYEQARRVIVWLGEGSPDINRVFGHLSLFTKLGKIPWYPVRAALERKLALRIDKIQQLGDEEIRKLPRTGLFVQVPQDWVLKDVFSRTWFKRMWTLQEAILATECIVQCGSATLAWDTLCSLDGYFSSSGKAMRADDPVQIHRELRRRLDNARGQGYSADQDVRLSSLLRATQEKEVTDPRDRVYALYGIFRAIGVDLPPPDYSKGIVQVFQETTAKAIAGDKSLTVLYHAMGAIQDPILPSWVPDWNDSSPPWSPINFFFRPSGESPVLFETLQDGKHLCLWGKTIDTVETTTPALEAATFMENNQPTDAQTMLEGIRWTVELVKVTRQWLELALESSSHNSHAATSISLLRTFLYSDMPMEEYLDEFVNWLWILLSGRTNASGEVDKAHLFHTWLAESTGGPPLPPPQAETAFREQSQAKMTRPRSPNPNISEDMASFARFYDFDNPELAELANSRELGLYGNLINNDEAKAFQEKFIRINRDRRFFVSLSGKMGTGSTAVGHGDQIVLFSGARQPFIIRSKEDTTYQLLGPAYVDGIMYGDAWDTAWSAEDGLDRIVLS